MGSSCAEEISLLSRGHRSSAEVAAPRPPARAQDEDFRCLTRLPAALHHPMSLRMDSPFANGWHDYNGSSAVLEPFGSAFRFSARSLMSTPHNPVPQLGNALRTLKLVEAINVKGQLLRKTKYDTISTDSTD